MTDAEKLTATFDMLVDRLGLGFDCQFVSPVPQWFFDALCDALVRAGEGSLDEISEGLTIDGWRVDD